MAAFVAVLGAMAAERRLLSSCYTPRVLRVHMCGQLSAGKSAILRGWCQQQQQQIGTFWMNMFQSQVRCAIITVPFCRPSFLMYLQTAEDDSPGVEVSRLLLQNRSADICVWNYEGSNEASCMLIF